MHYDAFVYDYIYVQYKLFYFHMDLIFCWHTVYVVEVKRSFVSVLVLLFTNFTKTAT